MSRDLIAAATKNLIAQHGRTIIGHVLLTRGDGTGTLIADLRTRLAYYHQPSTTGQLAPGMAVLHPSSNIPFVNRLSYETVEVQLGYDADDPNTLYLFGETASSAQASGGVTIIERVIGQLQQPSQSQIAELLVLPVSTPTTEVYVQPGCYLATGDNSRHRFPGDITSDLTAAIGTLAAGEHQIAWVCLEMVGGTLVSQFGSAGTAIDPLPAPYEFSDNAVLGVSIGTAYKPITPVYLYYGQAEITEVNVLRAYDQRFVR